jgi:ATP-dependent Lon protease
MTRNGAEHAAVAHHWQPGSLRLRRRLVDAILRERDLSAKRI